MSELSERVAKVASKIRKPTTAQIIHLERLLNDCGYTPRTRRNAFLTAECNREIKFVDELSFAEASRLISELTIQRDLHEVDPWTSKESDF
jgi:hypothetical protein